MSQTQEHRPVLAHARAIYRGEEPEVWTDQLRSRVRPHADHVLTEISRLSGSAVPHGRG